MSNIAKLEFIRSQYNDQLIGTQIYPKVTSILMRTTRSRLLATTFLVGPQKRSMLFVYFANLALPRKRLSWGEPFSS